MYERERQTVSGLPSLDELVERATAGWSLVALEWQREISRPAQPARTPAVELPYGLRVSSDGLHLEENPEERRVLMSIMNSIVDDRPLSHAATELNRAGLTTREGADWTPAAVFDLLPRTIEMGPRIFSSAEWVSQRERQKRSA
jgi:hypothetical protein